MSTSPAPILPPPRVIAEALPCFLDGETWGFTITVKDPATSNPMNLTGSRLWARFVSVEGEFIGVCDSDAGDDSLSIPTGTGGQAAFLLPAAGRAWSIRLVGNSPDVYRIRTAALGDLYRKVTGSDWQPICRIRIPLMPTTGAPPQS